MPPPQPIHTQLELLTEDLETSVQSTLPPQELELPMEDLKSLKNTTPQNQDWNFLWRIFFVMDWCVETTDVYPPCRLICMSLKIEMMSNGPSSYFRVVGRDVHTLWGSRPLHAQLRRRNNISSKENRKTTYFMRQ